VRRIKVALDANVPQRLVWMLQSGFGDQGFEFLWEPNFAAANAKDEAWTAAFRRFGGQLVITGDKNLAKRPHQILAFMESGLIGFFFERRWANHDLPFKAAHMMIWWPRIQSKFGECKPRECWWVPGILGGGDFRRAELPQHVQAKGRKISI